MNYWHFSKDQSYHTKGCTSNVLCWTNLIEGSVTHSWLWDIQLDWSSSQTGLCAFRDNACSFTNNEHSIVKRETYERSIILHFLISNMIEVTANLSVMLNIFLEAPFTRKLFKLSVADGFSCPKDREHMKSHRNWVRLILWQSWARLTRERCSVRASISDWLSLLGAWLLLRSWYTCTASAPKSFQYYTWDYLYDTPIFWWPASCRWRPVEIDKEGVQARKVQISRKIVADRIDRGEVEDVKRLKHACREGDGNLYLYRYGCGQSWIQLMLLYINTS